MLRAHTLPFSKRKESCTPLSFSPVFSQRIRTNLTRKGIFTEYPISDRFMSDSDFRFTVGRQTQLQENIPPAAVQMNESFLKKSSAANFRAEQIKDAVHLLCINPAACEIFKVEGSSVVRVFDGDELCGYKVYSGGRLLEAKEIFG